MWKPKDYTCACFSVMETTGKSYRSLGGIGTNFAFSIGYAILPWVAYALKNDTYLQLSMTLPAVLYISIWW